MSVLLLASACEEPSDPTVVFADAGRRDASADAGDGGVEGDAAIEEDAGLSEECTGTAHELAVIGASRLSSPAIAVGEAAQVVWLAEDDVDDEVDEGTASTPSALESVTLAADGSAGGDTIETATTAILGAFASVGEQLAFVSEVEGGPSMIGLATLGGDAFESTPMSGADEGVLMRVNPAIAALADESVVFWSEVLESGSASIVARRASGAAPVVLVSEAGQGEPLSFAVAASDEVVGVVRAIGEDATRAVQVQTFAGSSLAPIATLEVATNERITDNLALAFDGERGFVVWEEQEVGSGIRRLHGRLISVGTETLEIYQETVPISAPGQRGTLPRVVSHLGGFGVSYVARPFSSSTPDRSVVVAFVSGSSGYVEERVELAELAETSSPVTVATTEAGLLVAAWYDVSMTTTSTTSTLKTITVDCPTLWLQCGLR